MKSAPGKPEIGRRASDAGLPGTERRKSHREPVTTLGMLRCLDDSEFERPKQVMIHNVSLHGVGFRSMERLDGDLTYVIEIGVGPLHLTGQLQIVRNRTRPDGTYDVGAEFI
ncbi:hypothetical protein BH09PLA1_BH09PLA1_07050 [soil metagenome]